MGCPQCPRFVGWLDHQPLGQLYGEREGPTPGGGGGQMTCPQALHPAHPLSFPPATGQSWRVGRRRVLQSSRATTRLQFGDCEEPQAERGLIKLE